MPRETQPTKPRPPRWYEIALGELDVSELAGDATNPRIAEYFDSTTLGGSDPSDETPWCSAFVNWCVERAGLEPTRRANARSWLTFGEELAKPRLGCICVFWRGSPKSTQGHVGFYAGSGWEQVKVLGGNQQNKVCIAPYERARLLRYCWPIERKST